MIYQQTNQTQNGIYVVTNVGSGASNWILTRSSDADTYVINSAAGLSEGSTVFVQQGTTGAGETYTCNTSGVIVFGTTNISFAQISSAQIYSAGTGLTLTGTQFSITNTAVTAASYGTASSTPTLAINAQGQVTSASNTAIVPLPTGRISGSYTGITAVGTLTAGTWNATAIGVAYGGTGLTATPTNGQLAIGNGTGYSLATLTAGGNVSITNSAGGITISATPAAGGTVTSVAGSGGTTGLTLSGGPITVSGTLTLGGTLVPANGGTGATTLTGYFKGVGTSTMTASATIPSTDITGLGTMSTQAASAVAITGGTINGATVGATTAATVRGTTITATTQFTGSGAGLTSIPNSATTATNANTASTIVARDASGNFTAGTITAALSGNATTATTAANVNNGTLTMNVSGTGLSGSQTFTANQSAAATFTVTSNATNANTASTIVARDASGNFTAGTITAALTGTASGNLALAGGTMTGQITTRVASGATPIVSGSGSNALQVMGDGTNGAYMSFHRSGAYAINFGMDTSNVVSLGGWSDGATSRWTSDTSGNFVARGNVTAYSDERLKKDWAPVAKDFVERLAKVKHGTYTRTDSEERQAGVSAQEWQKLLAETVLTSADGFLSVAYGNAALVAAVKLAERVVALEARLAALEAKG